MSTNPNMAEPIHPGQAPKKDNTLKIVVICLILFVGLPILLVFVLIIFTFGWVGRFADRMIDEFGDAVSVQNALGERIVDSDLDDILHDSFDAIYQHETYSNVSKGDCREIEDLIITETGKNFAFCDEDGFSGYAYNVDGAKVLGLFGIDDDLGYLAEIKLNLKFNTYYKIEIKRNDGTHEGRESQTYYYNRNRALPDTDPEDEESDDIESEEDEEDFQLDRA